MIRASAQRAAHIPLLRLPQPAPQRLLEQMIAGVIVGRAQAHLNQPWVNARTIRVDSTNVGVVDFDITAEQTQAIYRNGYQAAQTFLATWNWQTYLTRFRPATETPD